MSSLSFLILLYLNGCRVKRTLEMSVMSTSLGIMSPMSAQTFVHGKSVLDASDNK